MNTYAFAQLLKDRRQELNYSQSKVAKLCFICKSTYNHYERGLRAPSLESALKISHALKLDPITVLKALIPEESKESDTIKKAGVVQDNPPDSSPYQSKYTETFNQLDPDKQKALIDIMNVMLSTQDDNLR